MFNSSSIGPIFASSNEVFNIFEPNLFFSSSVIIYWNSSSSCGSKKVNELKYKWCVTLVLSSVCQDATKTAVTLDPSSDKAETSNLAVKMKAVRLLCAVFLTLVRTFLPLSSRS